MIDSHHFSSVLKQCCPQQIHTLLFWDNGGGPFYSRVLRPTVFNYKYHYLHEYIIFESRIILKLQNRILIINCQLFNCQCNITGTIRQLQPTDRDETLQVSFACKLIRNCFIQIIINSYYGTMHSTANMSEQCIESNEQNGDNEPLLLTWVLARFVE